MLGGSSDDERPGHSARYEPLTKPFDMVELLGSYSRLGRQLGHLRRTVAMLDEAWSDRPVADDQLPRRVSMRLSAEQQRDLVRDYEAGMTGQELAERYGVARSAVIQFLRGRGVTIGRSRLSEADMVLIIELYRAGVRQVDIAKRLGRDKGLIWHALRRAGEL